MFKWNLSGRSPGAAIGAILIRQMTDAARDSTSPSARGSRARVLGPLRASRHGPVARRGRGRRTRLSLPRLAVRDQRRVYGDPATRGSDAGPEEGEGTVVRVRGALRDRLGRPGGAAVA